MYIYLKFIYTSGFIPTSKSGRRKLIPTEIENSLIKRLLDKTPGRQLNYDEQIELIVGVSYKVYTLRPEDERRKLSWNRPSRRTISRYIKKFNLQTCKPSVQTLARYHSKHICFHIFI